MGMSDVCYQFSIPVNIFIDNDMTLKITFSTMFNCMLIATTIICNDLYILHTSPMTKVCPSREDIFIS